MYKFFLQKRLHAQAFKTAMEEPQIRELRSLHIFHKQMITFSYRRLFIFIGENFTFNYEVSRTRLSENAYVLHFRHSKTQVCTNIQPSRVSVMIGVVFHAFNFKVVIKKRWHLFHFLTSYYISTSICI